jgi:hypothetical protein
LNTRSFFNNEFHIFSSLFVVICSQHHFRIRDKDHIDGVKSKARFGMSLAFLGDINKDGFDDIAVGAPYDGEKGTGAVYIYLGSKTGLQDKFAQVIYAESINDPGLKTFGFSLSGGLDLDNNQYPDLLVGAYASDRAIFLKARPVVNMTATLTLAKDSISLDDKDCNLADGSRVPCFGIKLCLQYNGIGVENKLGLYCIPIICYFCFTKLTFNQS